MSRRVSQELFRLMLTIELLREKRETCPGRRAEALTGGRTQRRDRCEDCDQWAWSSSPQVPSKVICQCSSTLHCKR